MDKGLDEALKELKFADFLIARTIPPAVPPEPLLLVLLWLAGGVMMLMLARSGPSFVASLWFLSLSFPFAEECPPLP